MNNCKNSHYKSAIEFFNTTPQAITATTLITNPVTLSLGTVVTDTGVAIKSGANAEYIEVGGLYRIKADVQVTGTVAGDISLAIAVNGNVLPETLRTVTVAAGGTVIVPMETVKRLYSYCGLDNNAITIIAYSDGTGTGTITRLSGNIIKLA